MKSCITTFKGHNEEVTCVDISPDSMMIASGSMDGSIKLWDMKTNKNLRSIQYSNVGYPICLSFNPRELCIAVGGTDKIIRYWELSDFTLVSQTTIDNTAPQKLLFDSEGRFAFIAF